MLELSRWRIGVRLFAGFGIITFMLILIAAFGVNQIMKVDESKEIILHDRYAKVALAQSIENEVNRQARALRTALIASDKSVIESELGKVENSAPIIASTIEKLQNIIHTDKGKAALKTLVEARQAFKSDEQKLVGMIRSGQVEEGRSYLIKDMLPAQTAYLAAIEAFRESQVEGMEQFGKEADEIAHTALVMNIALAIGATLLSIFISVALTRSITTPIHPSGQDELAQLLTAMHSMQTNLAQVVNTVRVSSDSVSNASSEIAAGNQDLSARTESQASALEETSASTEQLTVNMRQNTENTQHARQLAVDAANVAKQGGEVMSQMAGTMSSISEASKKINEIISVIDGIAFQTNILALNAAVEAARAGEQGRGFAVVASEVRSLAGRSASAAKEIAGLIQTSVERVDQGNRLVDQAGQTMSHIVSSIQRVSDIVSEISAANSEQSAGMGHIEQAVTEMDRVTQQNAALVEEMAAAASSLRTQAGDLVAAVQIFKT